MSARPGRRAPVVAVSLLGATLALASATAATAGGAHAPRRPPNVIVIQADDQVLTDLRPRVMPHTESFLAGHGTTFTHYVVATPQCCPSRASLLTGEYPHNDGVFSDNPGYPALRSKADTLPAWLHRAGYFTAHIGKYLNGYSHADDSIDHAAPGWDDWFSLGGKTAYYNYDVGVNGHFAHFGRKPRDYVTRVLERRALGLIKHHAGGRRPLYLQLDERAPHEVNRGHRPPGFCGRGHRALPDPRDERRFSNLRLPKPPSFNEPDVSDKPSFIRARPSLTHSQAEAIRGRYRCRLAALRGVDRTVGLIHRALRRVGALRDTAIIYISDNGFFDGQHRIKDGKVLPYEEAVRQPLLIRAPRAYLGTRPRRHVGAEVANVDLAPTILALARARPCARPGVCRRMDGRSLVGLVRGNHPGWVARRAIVTEFRNPKPTDGVCAYEGLQLATRAYVHYTSTAGPTGSCQPSDERELYDLGADPFELRNELPAPPGSAAAADAQLLERRLGHLADCAGIKGRDPRLPGRHFCS